MKKNQEPEKISDAMRGKLAFEAGARASKAVVFMAAGGSSVGVVMLWPGVGMESLSNVRARADLMVLVEERLPEWLWVTESPPARPVEGDSPKNKWCKGRFSFSPYGAAGDSTKVEWGRTRVGGAKAPFEEALSLLDAAVGGPSYRMRCEGIGFLPEDLCKGHKESWEYIKNCALSETSVLAGGLSFDEFLLSIEALGCKAELVTSLDSCVVPERVRRRI